jgi:hypothetical protein
MEEANFSKKRISEATGVTKPVLERSETAGENGLDASQRP